MSLLNSLKSSSDTVFLLFIYLSDGIKITDKTIIINQITHKKFLIPIALCSINGIGAKKFIQNQCIANAPTKYPKNAVVNFSILTS